MEYDAVIVGAGPAGSFAAWLLARQGRQVALLDRERFPRDKVCGGGLSLKTLELLPFDLASVVHARVRRVSLRFGAAGADAEFDAGALAGCTVVREEFDALLLREAVAAGAEFFSATPAQRIVAGPEQVQVETPGGWLRCRWLLGADGVGSHVRRAVFGPHGLRYVPAVEMLLEPGAAALERRGSHVVLEMGAAAGGYGWVFPKRDHWNVGVFSLRGGRGIRRSLEEFVRRDPALAAARVRARRGHAIPVSYVRRCENGRVWLLGDAAGFVESMYGEGIYFALRSAQLAARAFAEAGGAPRPGAYARLVRGEILPELRAARWLARGIYAWPRFAFGRIAGDRRLQAWLAGLVTGHLSYRGCAVRMLAAAPWWVWAREATAPCCR